MKIVQNRPFKVLITLVLVTLVILVASCSKKEDAKDNTLRYAIWNKDQEPIMQEAARAFETANPGVTITIELTPYKQYFTKLETSITGGAAPDVFWMNGPNSLKYIRGGVLYPLDKDLADYDLSKYPKGLIDLYSNEGTLYGIPKDLDVTALWYNKELFDAVGESYPSVDWTWDDLIAVAAKLTDKSTGVYGMAFQFDSQVGIYNTIPQFGGFVISEDRKTSGYDNPDTIKGVQVWADLISSGVSPDAQTLTDNAVDDMFQSGKLAMTYAASWMVPAFMSNEAIKDKIDLVAMPVGTQKGAVIHGLANVVAMDSTNRNLAVEFVKFLGSKEVNDMQAKSGIVIPAYSDSQSFYEEAFPQINLNGFTSQMADTVMYPCSANTGKWFSVEQDYMKKVWALQITAEEACKAIALEMNKALAAE